MNVFKKFALTVGTVALLLGSSVYAMPKALDANYSVYKGSMNLGDMNLSLSYSGNQFHYYKNTQAKGFAALITKAKIIEKVDGSFNGNHIKPLKYYFLQSTRNSSRVENTRFIRNMAQGAYKDKKFNLKLPTGTVDRASLELALANDMISNKPRLTYNVMERGELKQYIFARQGQERLTTPAGDFMTTKVKVVRAGNKRSTMFWLAKKLDYMPVKIVHREKNDVITTVIKSHR
ncbi:MAG TPA: DUF3108 domain-containing protein [Leucothrix mucor]|uniref:DUF3108 domain-containing protein n=1 Tax=Leucothrix mucor TaxID=45248 RepID=A0A7V2T4F2_LEUMU|nr:DUF3108 domain-containing protein [Leucothrix mucor]